MKKFLCLCICFLSLFCLVSCGGAKEAKADSIETIVASELDKIEGFETLDSEIQKAISVAVRTKLSNEPEKSNQAKSKISKQAFMIASSTKGETLNLTKEQAQKIEIGKAQKLNWTKEIKKTQILSALSKHNIKLSNISKIHPKYDKDQNLKALDIAGKEIPYETLKNEFGLISNKITDIKTSLTSITIFGKNLKNECYFDITEAKQLREKKLNYEQLLNHFYSNSSAN